jgi:hypothetical protein
VKENPSPVAPVRRENRHFHAFAYWDGRLPRFDLLWCMSWATICRGEGLLREGDIVRRGGVEVIRREHFGDS